MSTAPTLQLNSLKNALETTCTSMSSRDLNVFAFEAPLHYFLTRATSSFTIQCLTLVTDLKKKKNYGEKV